MLINHCNTDTKSEQLSAALNDSLKISRDKNGNLTGKILVLEASNVDAIINQHTDDSVIKFLQVELARNKKLVKTGGSVAVLGTTTNIDTSLAGVISTGKDTITKNDTVFVYPEYSKVINQFDNWIKGQVTMTKDSLTLSLQIDHAYSIVVGRERKGLFKTVPVAFVTSYNPYDTLDNFRVGQVTVPKSYTGTKIGVGVIIGTIIGYLLWK